MHVSNPSENMSNLVVTVELSECHKYLFIFFIAGIKMLGYKKVVHYKKTPENSLAIHLRNACVSLGFH